VRIILQCMQIMPNHKLYPFLRSLYAHVDVSNSVTAVTGLEVTQ